MLHPGLVVRILEDVRRLAPPLTPPRPEHVEEDRTEQVDGTGHVEDIAPRVDRVLYMNITRSSHISRLGFLTSHSSPVRAENCMTARGRLQRLGDERII